MRFVHLAPASEERTIARAGLSGAKAEIYTGPSAVTPVRRAVFAMPVIGDFWTTYQWLREMRRNHDDRIVAVYFRVPDDEPVYVGRYNEPHRAMSASDAARWVMDQPAGAEVVVPRTVGRKEVLRIRPLTQLVGWTEVPEPEKRMRCLCQACVPRGARDLRRRVRGAITEALLAARTARSPEGILDALGRMEVPLERARSRGLDPKGILVHARSRHPQVRRAAARLLGYFRRSQVEGTLVALLSDEDEGVSSESVQSLARVAGARAAADRLNGAPEAVVLQFLEVVEYETDDAAAASALETMASHPAASVRRQVAKVAAALLAEGEARGVVRERLLAIDDSAS